MPSYLIISAKYTVAIFLQSREDGVGLSSPWEDGTRAHGNPAVGLLNGVSSIKTQRTNSESQCRKLIHKKSVGKAENSKNFEFLALPTDFFMYYFPTLIFRVRPWTLNIIVTEPHPMPQGETSLVVGSGWNTPLVYICLLKGDYSVKILRSRINGGSAARRLITRGSASCTFSLLHFHACAYFLVLPWNRRAALYCRRHDFSWGKSLGLLFNIAISTTDFSGEAR